MLVMGRGYHRSINKNRYVNSTYH